MGYCAVSGANFFWGHWEAGVTNICVNVWREVVIFMGCCGRRVVIF